MHRLGRSAPHCGHGLSKVFVTPHRLRSHNQLFTLSPLFCPGITVRNPPIATLLVLICHSMLCAPLLLAQDDAKDSTRQREWSLDLGAGLEYDTNVTVDEVDLSSGQDDSASVLDLGLGVKQPIGEKSTFSLNYNLSQSSYRTYSRVDRRTQIIGSDFSRNLGRGNAGVSAYYIDAQLDGQSFLEYLRLSPSVSGFLARKWFARTAYVYSERRIQDREQRNADTQVGEVDVYYFHRGLRSYINVGYRYRDENAIAPELDFSSHLLKLRYIRRIDIGKKRVKAEMALRFEQRDYRSAEPTIDEPRDDTRLRLKTDLEIPLTTRLSWHAYASYGDYQSNLPRADFTQIIVGTRLELGW